MVAICGDGPTSAFDGEAAAGCDGLDAWDTQAALRMVKHVDELERLEIEVEMLMQEDKRLTVERDRLLHFSPAPAMRLVGPNRSASPPCKRHHTPPEKVQSASPLPRLGCSSRSEGPPQAEGSASSNRGAMLHSPGDHGVTRAMLLTSMRIVRYEGQTDHLGQAHGHGTATMADGTHVEGVFTRGRLRRRGRSVYL